MNTILFVFESVDDPILAMLRPANDSYLVLPDVRDLPRRLRRSIVTAAGNQLHLPHDSLDASGKVRCPYVDVRHIVHCDRRLHLG